MDTVSEHSPPSVIWKPRVIVLGVSVLLGVTLAYLSVTRLFCALPNDLARSRAIMDALSHPSESLKVCAFGSSIVMNGLDCRRVRRRLGDCPEVWNLSSTGQSLFESFLYYQNLPDSVCMVIQGVHAMDLEKDLTIPSEIYQAFFFSGYRPTPATLAIARQFAAKDTQAYLQQPDYRYRVDGRWIVPGAINTAVRNLLRRDLTVERALSDLHYPRAYTHAVASATLQRQFEDLRPQYEQRRFRPNATVTEFLRTVDRQFRSQGRRFVLVILPQHPRLQRCLDSTYHREMAEYLDRLHREDQLDIINCLDLLAEDQFVDIAHPSAIGANVLTDYVTLRLEPTYRCCSTRPISSSSR